MASFRSRADVGDLFGSKGMFMMGSSSSAGDFGQWKVELRGSAQSVEEDDDGEGTSAAGRTV